jgi:CubicO group peptidase (beta-lactamase class C family)
MAIAFLFAAAIIVAGGGALFFFLTISPGYADPSEVPSRTTDTSPGQYSGVVEDLRRRARALVVDENLPGLSVAIAVDGKIVWAEGFGYANIERRTPVTPLTRFRLGSVSKTLTAAALLLLHEQGRIDLDAPVQRYVPAYPAKQWTVTTRQVMGDIAGVNVIRGDNNDQVPHDDCASMDEALKFFAHEPLAFEPGTKYRFGTNGWILLSAVVEALAAEPFATFMTGAVLGPLGVVAASRRHNSCLFGAGAYLSTPSDLARFGSAMLKPGLLKADSLALLHTPLRLTSGAVTDFALGWKVERAQLNGATTRMVAHRATPMGGTTALLLFPEHRLVFAATSNVTNSRGLAPFGVKAAELFTATITSADHTRPAP